MEKVKIRWDALLRSIAFLGLGVFFGWLVGSGRIHLLLKPGLIWMTLLSAGALLLLGFLELQASMRNSEPEKGSCTHGHEHCIAHGAHHAHETRPKRGLMSSTVAFLLPAVFGVLTPLKVLDSDAAIHRGLGLTTGQDSLRHSGDGFLEQVDQVLRSEALGQKVDLIGFVARWEGLGPEEFVLTRFVVTCCAADAVPVGVKVIWRSAGSFLDNQWVRVQGRAKAETWDGRLGVVVRPDAVDRVEVPAVPYIYPGQ